jgi:hypothetical protein
MGSNEMGLTPKVESVLEILANLLYLATLEPPGSSRQIDYLARAEGELASLRNYPKM